MRLFTSLVAALTAILLLASCETPNGTPSDIERGQIKGTVFNSKGLPVGNAVVTTKPATASVRSDEDGTFIISVVAVGDYTVIAAHAEEGVGSKTTEVEARKNSIVEIILGVRDDDGGNDDGGNDDGGNDDGGNDDGGNDDGGNDDGGNDDGGNDDSTYFNVRVHLPLDGNAVDVTRHLPPGRVNGAIPTTNRRGERGMAMQFDGIDDFIEVMHNGMGDLFQKFPMTWSFWLRSSPENSTGGAFGATPVGIHRFPMGDGILFMWEGEGLTSSYVASGFQAQLHGVSMIPSDQGWHHVVMTVSYTGMDMFVDGHRTSSSRWQGQPTFASSNEPLRFGVLNTLIPGEGTTPYSGAIDDFMIFDGVLGLDEIVALGRR